MIARKECNYGGPARPRAASRPELEAARLGGDQSSTFIGVNDSSESIRVESAPKNLKGTRNLHDCCILLSLVRVHVKSLLYSKVSIGKRCEDIDRVVT